MEVPLQITFRGMESSPTVDARVREKAQKLEQFFNHITACNVVVEKPHHHGHKGNAFSVTIDIQVPGTNIIVNKAGDDRNHAHEDVYVAVQDAFNAANRQLEDYVRKMDGRVKTHETFTTDDSS